MDASRRWGAFLTLFVALHLGCGLAQQFGVFALTGEGSYGAGMLAGTPLKDLLSFTEVHSIFNLRGVFTALSDTILGLFNLVTFNYDWMQGHKDAALYVLTGLRAAMSAVSGMILLYIAQMVFNSGIFNSPAGLALVVGGAGISAVISSLLGN